MHFVFLIDYYMTSTYVLIVITVDFNSVLIVLVILDYKSRDFLIKIVLKCKINPDTA